MIKIVIDCISHIVKADKVDTNENIIDVTFLNATKGNKFNSVKLMLCNNGKFKLIDLDANNHGRTDFNLSNNILFVNPIEILNSKRSGSIARKPFYIVDLKEI